MKINNKTKIFISLSKFPGNTGALLHNMGYKLFNLNFLYIPFKCGDVQDLKFFVKNQNFSGISVSMPFKTKVIKYLNKLDAAAKKIGAVNTILRKKKMLYGYNTDYYALKKILLNKKINRTTVVIIGNGSTGKISYELLKELKSNKIILCSRSKKKYSNWKIRKNDLVINWKNRHLLKGDLLINCSPIGMSHMNFTPVKLNKKKQFKTILDFPINKYSKLKIEAKKFHIKYISGLEISLHQGLMQFEIYTQKKLSFSKAKKSLNYDFI